MKNLQFAPTPKPSRDCEGAVHYNPNPKRFFNGVVNTAHAVQLP